MTWLQVEATMFPEVPMSEVKHRIERFVSLYSKGYLTAKETVDTVLLDIAMLRAAAQITELVDALPVDIAHGLRQRLEQLKAIDFQWRPFMIGGHFSEQGLEELREQLKLAHFSLFFSQ